MSKSIKSFFKPVETTTKRKETEEKTQHSISDERSDTTTMHDNSAASSDEVTSCGKRKIEDITVESGGGAAALGITSSVKKKPTPSFPNFWLPVDQLRSWVPILENEFRKPYFSKLDAFLEREASSKKIFPPRELIFSAFNACDFEDIKVVVIGQDPYHGPNQAHGLAFSVMRPQRPPPSLKNIYKEIKSNIPNFSIPTHGDLSNWSKQGVFLLNTCLTVQQGNANSHQKKGWEEFITAVIRAIDGRDDGVVFLLWGKPASERCAAVSRRKHTIISSSHPSPLGATKTKAPFIGSNCFSKCNDALIKMGKDPINWNL